MIPEPFMIVRTAKGGMFYVTRPYLEGASDAQNVSPTNNPYRPGPEFAQYNYGYANEKAGCHDNIELPFEKLEEIPWR